MVDDFFPVLFFFFFFYYLLFLFNLFYLELVRSEDLFLSGIDAWMHDDGR